MTHLEAVKAEAVKEFHLSPKAKEAIKVALAYCIVNIIALKLDWMNPYWAGFAVAQIALFPGGQSLRMGGLRIVGVILAMFACLLIYTIAPQDRWMFISLAAMWMMFTTYMMIKDQKHSYLWNVAGFAAVAMWAIVADTSVDVFHAALYRAIETIMGIVVYTLVTVFIWPDSNVSTLKKLSVGLTSAQAKILGLVSSSTITPEVKKTLKATAAQELQFLGGLKQAFFAKGAETYEVQQSIGFWQEYHSLSVQLAQSFNRLNNGFSGLENIDIDKIVPGLDQYRQEIIRRLESARDIISDGAGEYKTEFVNLDINEAYLQSLAPFDTLAFTSSRQELEKAEILSRKILECAHNIVDESVSREVAAPEKQQSIYERLIPDLDHLRSLGFIGVLTFLAACVWIFFDPPGHRYWLLLPPTVGMMVAVMPQMKTNAMVIPAFFLLSFFLMIYVFVMPGLTSIAQLSALYFICIFCIFYFLSGVYQVVAVIGVVSKLMANNEQVYNFAGAANMVIWSVSCYAFIYILSYMLNSPRPQRALARLTRRYFRSAECLMSEMRHNEKPGVIRKFKIAFHRYEIRTLPLKIKSWSKAINPKHFPENTPDKIGDLLLGIATLSQSIEEWVSSNTLPQTKHLLSETKQELSKWNRGLERIFRDYHNDLGSALSSQVESDLKNHIATLEDVINRHSGYIEEMKASVSDQEKENLFRLVGSYHGLSLSLISYASVTERISWKHWEKEVFA